MSSMLDDDSLPEEGAKASESVRLAFADGLASGVEAKASSAAAIDKKLAQALETSEAAWNDAMAQSDWRCEPSANADGGTDADVAAFVFDISTDCMEVTEEIGPLLGAPIGSLSRPELLALLEPDSRIRAAEAFEEASVNLRIPSTILRLRGHANGAGRARLVIKAGSMAGPGGSPQLLGTLTRYEGATTTEPGVEAGACDATWSMHHLDRLAGVGCWRWEPKEGLLEWSGVLREIAGVTGTLLPTPVMHLSLIHDEDREEVEVEMQRVLRGGMPKPIDYRIVRPNDGEIRRVRVTSRVFRDEAGRVKTWLGTARDVTSERDIEQRLHHSQKMEAIGRLAGGVAHDFNNYLAVMLGNAELLAREMSDRDSRRRYVEEITRAGNRSRILVRQLLAFSRRQTTEPRLIDVNEVLSNVHRMLELMLGEQVGLETVLYDDLHAVVIDPSQFEQVIVNLVVNARDAIQGQGMVLIETVNECIVESTHGDTGEIPPGEYIKIIVSDDGIGISDEVMGNIFEPFFTTKKEGYGTGLGLSTAYGIIQRHGGYVRVRSEAGCGTAFEVLFPKAVQHEDTLVRRVFGESDRLPAARGGTVLFTEDESQVRALTRLQLERGGYEVLSAASADEAIRIAKNHEGTIDALVTDIVMPGINGIELASRLSAELPSLRILFVSGYAEVEIPKEGLMSTARLLPKPFTMKELLTTLSEIMEDGKRSEAKLPTAR